MPDIILQMGPSRSDVSAADTGSDRHCQSVCIRLPQLPHMYVFHEKLPSAIVSSCASFKIFSKPFHKKFQRIDSIRSRTKIMFHYICKIMIFFPTDFLRLMWIKILYYHSFWQNKYSFHKLLLHRILHHASLHLETDPDCLHKILLQKSIPVHFYLIWSASP